MPIDMQRAPKIPVGPSAATDLERVEIEPVEDGSYIVTCFHKPGKAAAKAGGGEGLSVMVGMSSPKRYTFQNADSAGAFVNDKLHGRNNPAKPEAAAPPAEAAPPEPPPMPPAEPGADADAEY